MPAGAFAQAGGQGGVLEQGLHGPGQSARVVGGHQQAVLPRAGAVLHSHGAYSVALTMDGEDFVPADFEGQYYRTHNATIYDRPDEPVPVYVAGSGPAPSPQSTVAE